MVTLTFHNRYGEGDIDFVGSMIAFSILMMMSLTILRGFGVCTVYVQTNEISDGYNLHKNKNNAK